MKILYKKDSKGKIRVWKIYTQGFMLTQESGLKDGKLVLHSKPCTGKNIGRSNETKPEEQAVLELESEYKSKLDEGYFPTEDEAKNESVVLPMLAKSYDDYKHKIDWCTAYIQPKLDGMRCLAHIEDGEVKLISRDGKEIQNMQHIIDELSNIKEDIILDGELYAHGLSFQENMKLIKKYRKDETEQIRFHMYDCISNLNFHDRLANAVKIVCNNTDPRNCIVNFVDTIKIDNQEMLRDFHSENIENGFEGSIIRWGNNGYKINGRSENLLKYKDFQDISLPIVNVISSDARPEQGVLVCKLPNGLECKASLKLSHKERVEILKNKQDYIGKQIAEIRYFQETDDGNLRFPVCVGFRLDK